MQTLQPPIPAVLRASPNGVSLWRSKRERQGCRLLGITPIAEFLTYERARDGGPSGMPKTQGLRSSEGQGNETSTICLGCLSPPRRSRGERQSTTPEDAREQELPTVRKLTPTRQEGLTFPTAGTAYVRGGHFGAHSYPNQDVAGE